MTFHNLVKKTLVPLAVLNGVAMVGSGVWLILLDVWQVAWTGVLGLMFSPFLFPFLMFPGAIFAGLMGQVPPSQPRKADVLMVCAALCFTATLAAYTIFLLIMASGAFNGATLLPAVIWALSAAVLPWCILGLKDRDNSFFISLLLLMQVMSIATAVLGFQLALGWWTAFFVMWGLMSLGACAVLLHDRRTAKTATP